MSGVSDRIMFLNLPVHPSKMNQEEIKEAMTLDPSYKFLKSPQDHFFVVNSKKDVIKSLPSDRRFRIITLFGHGNKNILGIGGGDGTGNVPGAIILASSKIDIKPKSRDLESFFERLSTVLERSHLDGTTEPDGTGEAAVIFLAGCNVEPRSLRIKNRKTGVIREVTSLANRVSQLKSLSGVLVMAPITMISPEWNSSQKTMEIRFVTTEKQTNLEVSVGVINEDYRIYRNGEALDKEEVCGYLSISNICQLFELTTQNW